MQYRKDPKSGNRLSALGFGCMRLPRKHGAIDQEESTALIQKAIEDGVNYFDTAYMYAGSEETLGRALQGGLREKIYIADKMPPPLCRNAADFDKLLHKMLDRLGTDYIDYLLIHMLTDVETWNRLCGLGIEDWIRTQKQAGRIRSIGFSYHGGQEEFPKLLEAYNWDFCQIQYNYIDENNQAGRSGLKKAHERGLPVIIMEPLLGGRLAENLPPAVNAAFGRQIRRQRLLNGAAVDLGSAGGYGCAQWDEHTRAACGECEGGRRCAAGFYRGGKTSCISRGSPGVPFLLPDSLHCLRLLHALPLWGGYPLLFCGIQCGLHPEKNGEEPIYEYNGRLPAQPPFCEFVQRVRCM